MTKTGLTDIEKAILNKTAIDIINDLDNDELDIIIDSFVPKRYLFKQHEFKKSSIKKNRLYKKSNNEFYSYVIPTTEIVLKKGHFLNRMRLTRSIDNISLEEFTELAESRINDFNRTVRYYNRLILAYYIDHGDSIKNMPGVELTTRRCFINRLWLLARYRANVKT